MHADLRTIVRGGIVLVGPLLLLESALSQGTVIGPLFPNPVLGLPAGGVVVGEFNGDGWPDLAISDPVRSEVVIEAGRGDATFAPERRFRVGSGPGQVVLGDFDRDGPQDLAVVNEGTSVNVS